MPVGYIKSPPGTPRMSLDGVGHEIFAEPPSAWNQAGPSRSRSNSVISRRASLSRVSIDGTVANAYEPPSAWTGPSRSRPVSQASHRAASRASVGASMSTHDTHSTSATGSSSIGMGRPGSVSSPRKSMGSNPRRRSSIIYGPARAPSRTDSVKTTSTTAALASATGLHFNPGITGVGMGRRPLTPSSADNVTPYNFLYNHSREFAHLHADGDEDKSAEELLRSQRNVIEEVRLGRLAHYVSTSHKIRALEKQRRTESRASSRLSTGSLALSRTSTVESGLRRLSLSPPSRDGTPDVRPLSLSMSPTRTGHATLRRMSDPPAHLASPQSLDVESLPRSSLSVDTIATEEIELGINQRLGIPFQPSAPPSLELAPSTPGRSTPTFGASPSSSQHSLPLSPAAGTTIPHSDSLDVAIRPVSSSSFTSPPSTYSISSTFSGDSYDLAQSRYYDAKFKREEESSSDSERRKTRHRRVLVLAETMRLLDGSSSRASQYIEDDTAHLGFLAALGGNVSIGGSRSDDTRGHRRRRTLLADGPNPITEGPETPERRQASSLDMSPQRHKLIRKDMFRVMATEQPNVIRHSDSSMESVDSTLIAAGAALMDNKPWLTKYPKAARRDGSSAQSDAASQRTSVGRRSVTTDFDGQFVATSAWHNGATDGVDLPTRDWPGFGFGEEEGLESDPAPRQKTTSRVSFEHVGTVVIQPPPAKDSKKTRRTTYSVRLWSRTSQSTRSTPSSQTPGTHPGRDRGFWKSLGVSSAHWRQNSRATTHASSSPYAAPPADLPDLSFESSPSNFSQGMPVSPATNNGAYLEDVTELEAPLPVPDFVMDLDTTSPLSTPNHSPPASPSPQQKFMPPLMEEPDQDFIAGIDTAFEAAFAQHVAAHVAANGGRPTTPFDAYGGATKPATTPLRAASRLSYRATSRMSHRLSRLSKSGGTKLDKSKAKVKKGLAWCARLLKVE